MSEIKRGPSVMLPSLLNELQFLRVVDPNNPPTEPPISGEIRVARNYPIQGVLADAAAQQINDLLREEGNDDNNLADSR
jgi:hypothetical protein